MMIWRRSAVVGFGAGLVVSVLLIVVNHNERLWASLQYISGIGHLLVLFFPTHIMLLPLAAGGSLSQRLPFYLAAIVGNGIIYSVVTQVATGLFMLAKKLNDHLRRGRRGR